MAARYPELAEAFDFLGDVLAASGQARWTGGSLEGCLAMRWEHDRAEPRWHSADPQQWADIWPLVQAAWQAASSDQVTWIARCILGLIGPQAQEDENPFGGQVQATGAGAGEAEERDPVGEPPMPDAAPLAPDEAPPVPDAAMAGDVEGAARLLARVLNVPVTPGRSAPHASRGALELGRYLEKRRKLFLQRTHPSRPAPLHLTWVIDRSGSMLAANRMRCAGEAARMGVRAAQLARVPVRVIAFDHEAEETVPFGLPAAEAQAAVMNIQARGSTCLAPALELALGGQRDPAARQVVLVISDGGLTEPDLLHCAALLRKHPDVLVLPVLIGEAVEHGCVLGWQATFQPLLLARDHQQLAQIIHARLRALRA